MKRKVRGNKSEIEIDLNKGIIKGRTIAKHWKEHIKELKECYDETIN